MVAQDFYDDNRRDQAKLSVVADPRNQKQHSP
jgi:hypothetical protein